MMADLDVQQAPPVDAPPVAPAPAPEPERPGAPRPGRRRLVRALALAVVLAGLVAVPVALRSEADDIRRQADAARAEADAAAARRQRVDAAVGARQGDLDAAYVDAAAATAARRAQQERLAELQLTEATLDGVVTQARADTEAREGERDEADGAVQRNARDLPQLEGCLVEVRGLVDVAFQATVHPEVTVPPIGAACRALIAATTEAA